MMISHLIISAISVVLLPILLSEAVLKEKDAVTDSSLDKNEVVTSGSHEAQFKGTDLGWSTWSTWSVCSRNCGGGVTYQLRKCLTKEECHGEAAKYKICNMEACQNSQDFRATQCAAYNPVPYRLRLYDWLPYLDPQAPCSLTCTAKNLKFVAKLASKVKDGTRCREGSLDMCVDGKCLPVGCDLVLGSEKKVDDCGVCGGDGSTCRRPVYVWGKTPFSPCSVSCGGGYQMSRPVCLNKANEKEVDELLCDRTTRPVPEIKECNPHKCPPVWVTDSWSPCSASCGGGRQSRQVHCAQMGSEGVRSPVSADECLRQKPLTERPCNMVPCPMWINGPWSGCSVTCGKGQKIRSVACEDAKGQHSEDCDIEQMPKTKQDCDSELVCRPSEDPGTYLFSDIFKGSQEDSPPRPPYWSSSYSKKTSDVSTEPSYVVGEWGPCSVSCGQGFRKRTVDCKIFLEFSRTVAKLQDYECPGTKPPGLESCYPRPCSFDLNRPEDRKKMKGHFVGIEVTYSWRSNGFTPCSASCLGGTRESVIQCIRDHDQAVVKATQCDITLKPDAITQTCNDHPCPPKWNVSDFSPCTKPCGGGEMTRKVQCLHEVLRGAANTLVVENSNCPQPPPLEKQFCNVFECPSQWKTDPWSKCSKSCGGGEKIRKIRCMKEKAFGQVVELAPSQCSKHRPKSQKACNTKPCPDGDDIVPSHGSYIQQHPQRRVFLKVGGRAVVFAETNLKIRCPSRNANKTNIIWLRDDEQIKSSKRLKVSMKGALRIRRIAMKDSGKYTCMSGSSRADIFITVKPLPAVVTRIDEDKTVESLQPSTTGTRDKDKTSEEKFSHERKPTILTYDNKNYNTFVTNNKNKAHPANKVDFGNSVEDTFEDNRHQFHYKTNLKNDQDSHQDFNNKVKHSSTESSIVEVSTLSRIPLYMQVRSTTKPIINPIPTVKVLVKPLDSDELAPHRGQYDVERNRHRVKSKNYDTTSEEKSPNQVFPPRYGDTGKQTYDGALVAKNKKKEIYDRNDLVSDQEELNIGTPHGGKGFPGSVESGASSIHGASPIKNLLMNLPSLRTTSSIYSNDEGELEPGDMEHDEGSFLALPTNMVANSVVLGKGKAENLEFDWVIADWSPCSQSCGGSGYQVRSTQCLVRLNNISKPVDSTLCEDAGLATPTTIQSCGYEDCPHWETAPWSQCLDSQCFTWHTSYEKRAIYCRSANGTDLPLSQCDEKTRPRRKRECYNSKCRSTWKVGEWSECTASCGRHGFQSRILQCVWYGSTRPAGNACRDQQRPIVMRPCKGPSCQSNNCTDRSSYCSLAKTLHLCRLGRYHLQCCESCRTREKKG